MGKELDCTMEYRGQVQAGRVYLESDHLLFRGDIRLKILFPKITSVKAREGWLRVGFDGEDAGFEIGEGAGKWADKILHPPSRLSKLGIQAGTRILLVGKLDDDFLSELEATGAERVRSGADLIFFAAERRADLESLSGLERELRAKSAVWIVYPKGVEAIRETDVIAGGRGGGLKDTKVVAFSKTHTALKFLKS